MQCRGFSAFSRPAAGNLVPTALLSVCRSVWLRACGLVGLGVCLVPGSSGLTTAAGSTLASLAFREMNWFFSRGGASEVPASPDVPPYNVGYPLCGHNLLGIILGTRINCCIVQSLRRSCSFLLRPSRDGQKNRDRDRREAGIYGCSMDDDQISCAAGAGACHLRRPRLGHDLPHPSRLTTASGHRAENDGRAGALQGPPIGDLSGSGLDCTRCCQVP
jgi:hypothetical protein